MCVGNSGLPDICHIKLIIQPRRKPESVSLTKAGFERNKLTSRSVSETFTPPKAANLALWEHLKIQMSFCPPKLRKRRSTKSNKAG